MARTKNPRASHNPLLAGRLVIGGNVWESLCTHPAQLSLHHYGFEVRGSTRHASAPATFKSRQNKITGRKYRRHKNLQIYIPRGQNVPFVHVFVHVWRWEMEQFHVGPVSVYRRSMRSRWSVYWRDQGQRIRKTLPVSDRKEARAIAS